MMWKRHKTVCCVCEKIVVLSWKEWGCEEAEQVRKFQMVKDVRRISLARLEYCLTRLAMRIINYEMIRRRWGLSLEPNPQKRIKNPMLRGVKLNCRVTNFLSPCYETKEGFWWNLQIVLLHFKKIKKSSKLQTKWHIILLTPIINITQKCELWKTIKSDKSLLIWKLIVAEII